MRFFVLRPWKDQLFGRHFAYADVLEPQIVGDNRANGVCPACGDGLGMRPWLPPHRVKLSNSRYPDFLWGAGFDLMVSDRTKLAIEECGITGLGFDPPAEVVRVARTSLEQLGPRPPEYHNTRLTYGGASLDDLKSGAKRPPVGCSYCRQSIDAVKRVVLEPDSWGGSDVFEAHGLPGHILASERFTNMVARFHLQGAEFIPAEDYNFDF